MSDASKPERTTWRLTLMPEVLPTPQTAATGDARRRTIAHLQRVMATTAAAAALSAACGAPRQIDVTGSTPRDKTDGIPPETRDSDPAIPPDERGYMVVDMLPPPALCSGLAASTQSTATWVRDNDVWLVQLTLSKPESGFLGDGGQVTSINGEVVGYESTAEGGLTIRWRPRSDTQGLGALLVPAVRGDLAQSIAIELYIDRPSERSVGRPISIRSLDACR